MSGPALPSVPVPPPPPPARRLERITPSGTIWFPEWFDLFTVDPATTVQCPDCEEESPILENVYALAKWAAEHEMRCKA